MNPVPERIVPQRAFVVQHRDPDVLLQSTSGGALSAFAQVIIAHGGIVFGAGYLHDGREERDPTSPARLKVGHFGVDDERELWRFRNSKYVQSAIGPSFREVYDELQSGREVLFVGTPCQCEGLLRFLGKRPENLFVADVVCRAVVVRAVFARYLEWLDARCGTLSDTVLFRDKRANGYRYSSLRAVCGDARDPGKTLYCEGVESDPYLRAFFSDICDRPSCYACAFKKRYRESDLTCWDCFDVERLAREFDNNRGVTRVLVHSDAGQRILEASRAYACIKEIDVNLAVEGVREMTQPVRMNPKRAEFMDDAVAMCGSELFDAWFPRTARVRIERLVRLMANRLGVYDQVKNFAKRFARRR